MTWNEIELMIPIERKGTQEYLQQKKDLGMYEYSG